MVAFVSTSLQKENRKRTKKVPENYSRQKLFVRKIIKLLAFSLAGVLFALLLLELLTRIFLQPGDAPDIYFQPILGNTFIPNQQGLYVKGKNKEIKAQFRINSAGWNSPHEYSETKSPDTHRIAVVGDSFIEGLQVNYDQSYPYILEKSLNETQSKKFEVYTFGHSGANLIHYSHITEFASDLYKPEIVIVNIVSNDFLESINGDNRKDNWSLQPIGNTFIEIPPAQIKNLFLKRIVRHSALVRYLIINLDLINTSPLINKIFYAETKQNNKQNTQLNTELNNDDLIYKSIFYSLSQFSRLAKRNHFKTLFVVDSDRKALYSNKEPELKFNKMVESAGKELNLDVLDLTDTFSNNWKENHKQFDWNIDEHWNAYGHQVVAQAVEQETEVLLNQTR